MALKPAEKPRLLLVHDDPEIRKRICQMAKAAGVEMHEAQTASQALELTRQHAPHLAVVDWGLPCEPKLVLETVVKAGVSARAKLKQDGISQETLDEILCTTRKTVPKQGERLFRLAVAAVRRANGIIVMRELLEKHPKMRVVATSPNLRHILAKRDFQTLKHKYGDRLEARPLSEVCHPDFLEGMLASHKRKP